MESLNNYSSSELHFAEKLLYIQNNFSRSLILYIQYFFSNKKDFPVFLIGKYIYTIYTSFLKLTYLLLTYSYKYICFFLSSGNGGKAP